MPPHIKRIGQEHTCSPKTHTHTHMSCNSKTHTLSLHTHTHCLLQNPSSQHTDHWALFAERATAHFLRRTRHRSLPSPNAPPLNFLRRTTITIPSTFHFQTLQHNVVIPCHQCRSCQKHVRFSLSISPMSAVTTLLSIGKGHTRGSSWLFQARKNKEHHFKPDCKKPSISVHLSYSVQIITKHVRFILSNSPCLQ
jgi:hypothetical protein